MTKSLCFLICRSQRVKTGEVFICDWSGYSGFEAFGSDTSFIWSKFLNLIPFTPFFSKLV